ncbi:antigen 5 like allergen Cul n 1-like [Anopheles maculipalpis]|uniref:antigen 5 like allergen Cul n 1-like n=1 Tax=Anopheles maculipalpis TaxID=1496333 RepID=UPI002158B8F6|nr:antigen 5 like allergen Cul n 1-like [Anopheles maculipalpis]
MNQSLSFNLLTYLLLLAQRTVSYKDEEYCSICRDHVACGNVGTLHGNCSKYINVSLTILTHYQHQILERANDLRQTFAMGHLPGFNETFGPMHSVTWDPEMADLCRMNLNTCNFAHDKCRGTLRFPYSGQTLGKLTKCVSAANVDSLKIRVLPHVILHLIDRWYLEHEVTKPSDVKHYSQHSSARKFQIGHFLQLINCNVCRMGCSLLSYREHRKHLVCDTYILCCNYSYINIVNRPICNVNRYEKTCKKDNKFPALCEHCHL